MSDPSQAGSPSGWGEEAVQGLYTHTWPRVSNLTVCFRGNGGEEHLCLCTALLVPTQQPFRRMISLQLQCNAKFWLMNLSEWGRYVCTLIGNLDMQDKIILQILRAPQRSFQFLPGNYTELQWHQLASRHRHRQTYCGQTQKKENFCFSSSLAHQQ